jgi:hypothetical protein
MENTIQIDTMIHIKNLLECHSHFLDGENIDHDYHKIYYDVIRYLEKHCQHNMVTDLIDIDGDRSHSIEYCDICHTRPKHK